MAALFSQDVRFRQTKFAPNRVTHWGAWQPDAERLALPKFLDGGNLGLNNLVIRWMSVSRGRSA